MYRSMTSVPDFFVEGGYLVKLLHNARLGGLAPTLFYAIRAGDGWAPTRSKWPYVICELDFSLKNVYMYIKPINVSVDERPV